MKKVKLGIYFTLGDFGVLESIAILKGAAEGGAALLEVGLPFSDPLLDGPVIQASHNRSLKTSNLSWKEIVECVHQLSANCKSTQISIMCSAQLLYQPERTRQLPPVSGFLVTDITYNQISPVELPSPRVWFLSQDLVLSKKFSAPTDDISMVYLTRVQGVTGANQSASVTTANAIKKIKQHTNKSIWLGFGITNALDLQQCADQGAEGGIVGSAFVNSLVLIEQDIPSGTSHGQRCEILNLAAKNWVKNFLEG